MIDGIGLIVQSDGDGGDCPARCGVVIGWLAKTGSALPGPSTINNQFIYAAQLIYSVEFNLHTPQGYIRYPGEWPDPKDFSRDQASRLMCGYAIAGRGDLVYAYYDKVVENGGKHPNGDYMGTGEPGNILRACNAWWAWPILCIFDLKFLFDVLVGGMIQPWDYQNLYLMDLYYANVKYCTPIAWLAKKLLPSALAISQVNNNLISTTNVTTNPISPNNPCTEAGQANLFFIQELMK